MKTLSPAHKALLFAMGAAIFIPLLLWSCVQLYEWSCATWVSCEGMKKGGYR